MVRSKVMVVALRIADDIEVLLLKRPASKGSVWQPVTGNVEEGESVQAAAVRELEEETGLRGAAAVHPVGHIHRFSKSTAHGPADFEEHVFAAYVRLGSQVKLSAEHTESKWVSPEEAQRLLPQPGVQDAVRRAVELIARGGAQ